MRRCIVLVLLILLTIGFSYQIDTFQEKMIKICSAYGMNDERAQLFSSTLIEECTLFNMNPLIMFVLAIAESGLKNTFGDGGGAVGYFQLHKEAVWFVATKYGLTVPENHKDLIYFPELQIKIAIRYMHYLMERYGTMDKALEMWNGSAQYVTYYHDVFIYLKTVYLD